MRAHGIQGKFQPFTQRFEPWRSYFTMHVWNAAAAVFAR